METVFSLAFLLVAPFWALIMVLPHWRWTERIAGSPFVSVPAALLYAVLVLPRFGEVFPEVSNPTLGGISTLLASPAGATIAWAHFLAFDLFVGRWIYLDNRQQRISAWLMAPILFFALMLGPVGLLGYLLLRGQLEIAANRQDNRQEDLTYRKQEPRPVT